MFKLGAGGGVKHFKPEWYVYLFCVCMLQMKERLFFSDSGFLRVEKVKTGDMLSK